MTTNSWTAGGGLVDFGTENASDPDWLLGHTPTTSEDAVINTGASGALIIANSNEDVGSISLGGNDVLSIGGGSIFATVNGTGPNVNSGTISINDADLVIGNTSSTSTFDNGSGGSIVLNGTGASAPAVLFIQGSINLTGSGTIDMGADDPAADNVIVGDFFDGGTNTLTDKTEDIAGSGTIGGDLNFINDATVESQNGTLIIEGSAGGGGFTNNSAVTADNGGAVVFGEDGQSSTIVNDAEVELDTTGSTTSLKIAGNVTISGTGAFDTIALTGSSSAEAADHDQIVSDGHPATLTLVNQTIKGAGTVGDAHLTLDNQSGTISADDPGETLELNTGNNTITNGGTLQSTGDNSVLNIDSAVNNAGLIEATEFSTLNLNGAVDNTGTIEATESSVIQIGGPVNSATGTIEALDGSTIAASAAITGSVDIGTGGMLSTTAAINGSVSMGANSVIYLIGAGSVSGDVTLTGTDEQIWFDTGGPHEGLNGNLVGAQAGDTMIMFNLVYTSSMHVVWTQTSSSGGTLALQEGGSTIFTFNLEGQYASNGFSVGSFVDGSAQINLANPIASAGTTGAMIMRDGGNGAYEIYDLGDNGIQAAYALGQIGTAWQVAGVGGFEAPDTSDMMLRNSSTGAFEIADVSNNNVTASVAMGQVGLEWKVSGFGDFSGNAGETDMLMQNTNSGDFEVYDIANNQITSAQSMGQVGLAWVVAGFGDFSGHAGETGDMLMRNSSTGAFEIYDITNNGITFASGMGQVGLEWSVAGFGDFSGNANETDMLMRNNNTGAFELYDISGNQITNAVGMGQVGLEWQVAGFGPINAAGESDMLMRNTNTGAFEIYDITDNQIVNATSMGQVGTEWSVAGIAADPPGSSPANAQLTQAMAALGATGGSVDAGGPLGQVATPSAAISPLVPSNGQGSQA